MLVFEDGRDVWVLGRIISNLSDGHDLLKMTEASSASSQRRSHIPTRASTFPELCFCEQAAKGPCSSRPAGAVLALHSVHWNLLLLCLMYAKVLTYCGSPLKFQAQLMFFKKPNQTKHLSVLESMRKMLRQTLLSC